jgi:hypothetical protein
VSALVLAGLTGFVVLVYLVVVLGVGALVRRTSSPDLALSVAATIVVALAFDPVQSVLERAAARLVYRGTTPPYDVWERFSSTVTGSYPAEELPARMARVLAEGTGAKAAEVWLVVDGRPTPAATWPPHASPVNERAPGRRVLPVRYAGEELGLLVVVEDAPLTAVEERLFTGLAGQAGLVLRSARLRAELESRIAEQRSRAEELRLSRQRLVDVQDERRRALERNITTAPSSTWSRSRSTCASSRRWPPARRTGPVSCWRPSGRPPRRPSRPWPSSPGGSIPRGWPRRGWRPRSAPPPRPARSR